MESVKKLAEKAVALSPPERIQLVEAVLSSLDRIDVEIEKRWVAESEERYEAYRRGEIGTVDWEEIKERYSQ